MYTRFNLRAWPFQVVPDADGARIWAGRKQTRSQLESTLQKIQLSPTSGLRVLWASFGMGKTHTLLHISHRCQQTGGRLIPIYAVMPNRPASFLDLYRAIVSELPFEFLSEQILKIGSGQSGGLAFHPIFAHAPGLVNALLALRSGEIERNMLARQWMAAQPGLGARDLRTLGVSNRIRTAEDAVHVLTALTRLVSYRSVAPTKLVVMVDEYQRIGELRTNVRNDINAGVHTYFNANPTGLELILIFSFGRADNVKYLLSGELKSRADLGSIHLDALTAAEAEEFMRDLLDQYRINADEQWAYPFTPSAVSSLVQYIAAKTKVTPRRLVRYGDYLLSQLAVQGDAAPSPVIDTQQVKEWLSGPSSSRLVLDEDDDAGT